MEDLINYSYIKDYIDKNIPKEEDYMIKLEEYAKENYVPIVTKDTKRFIEVLLKIVQPKRVLELGTAIGYSAMMFLKTIPNCNVTTIEIKEEMFDIAKANLSSQNLLQRVDMRLGDAKDVLKELDGQFDFVFLDAAKGQYKEFFKLIDPLVPKGGIILSDNILFKGLVANDQLVLKNKKTLVKNLRIFIDELVNNPDYDTSIIPIGDGVTLSYKLV